MLSITVSTGWGGRCLRHSIRRNRARLRSWRALTCMGWMPLPSFSSFAPSRLPLLLTANVLPEKGVPSAVVGKSVGDVGIAQLDWTV